MTKEKKMKKKEELKNIDGKAKIDKEEEAKDEAEKEARRMIAKELNKRGIEANIIKEEIKMNERKYDVSSKEYRSAWAKTLMGVELNEEEKRFEMRNIKECLRVCKAH